MMNISKKNVSVGIFGFGNVGRELFQQVKSVGMSVGLIADSSTTLVANSDNGFSKNTLSELAYTKSCGKRLDSLTSNEFTSFSSFKLALERFKTLDNPIVADCSAYDNPENYLIPSLGLDVPVVLANKKPLTGKYSWYKTLTKQPRNIRMEATCGAGLPVLCTLDRLLASGDEIQKIEGQLSGTLGYILSELDTGRLFSEIVLEAVKEKYAEPDPRDDLSGTDVARKALILSRRIGNECLDGLDDVSVEALYPKSMAQLSVPEFMKELPSLDSYFKERINRCKSANTKLRYCATAETGKKIMVGLKEVSIDSPLAGLKGTNNLVSFHSKHYSNSPLVVVGPGAGVAVTANGVLADIADVMRETI